jgi:hypothetical protein
LQLLSSVDETRLNDLRFDNGGSRYPFASASSSAFHTSLTSSSTHLITSQQRDWIHLLKDLKNVLASSDSDPLSADGRNGFVGDNIQLHVLQDAFLSLNNFFQLKTPIEAIEEKKEENNNFVPSSPLRGGDQRSSSPSAGPHKKSGSSSTVSDDKMMEITDRLQHYKALLGMTTNQKVKTTQSSSSSSSATSSSSSSTSTATNEENSGNYQESSVLEAALMEDLLSTQEQLRRTQNRLSILELIQSDLIATNYSQQEIEKRKEKKKNPIIPKKIRRKFQISMNPNESSLIDEEVDSYTSSSSHHRIARGGGDYEEEEDDIEEVDEVDPPLSHEETVTYEEILKELTGLETCLSQRSSTEFALGMLLDHPITILNDQVTAPSSKASKHQQQNMITMIESIEIFIKDLSEELSKSTEIVLKKDNLLNELKIKEEALIEYKTQIEQIEIERNDNLTMSVELQILREKVQKYSKEENSMKLYEEANNELLKKIKNIEEQLEYHIEMEKKYKEKLGLTTTKEKEASNENNHGNSSAFSPNKGSSHRMMGGSFSSSSSSSHSSSGSSGMTNEEIEKYKETIQLYQTKNIELSQQNEHSLKEIQRLKTTINLSEQRVKSILQDSMILHSNIQSLEEDNMNSKATITKLFREIEDMKSLRLYKEDSERRLFDYQKEIMKYEIELVESRENNILINKYHNDLINAERTIESLEQRLAEYSVELEKGKIAINQLDIYRETIKNKLQEIRDLSLYVHSLENQLKDVPYLNTRYQELTNELSETKMKVDKIPGLLAEIARLRGSSRASIKALMEQDKLISTMKNRLKTLEKDNTLLKHENHSLLDLEMKLKESSNEIKRLMNLVTELQQSSGNNMGGSSGMGGGRGGGQAGSHPSPHKSSSIMMMGNKDVGDAGGGSGDGGINSGNKKLKRYMHASIFVSSPPSTLHKELNSESPHESNSSTSNISI